MGSLVWVAKTADGGDTCRSPWLWVMFVIRGILWRTDNAGRLPSEGVRQKDRMLIPRETPQSFVPIGIEQQDA